MGISQLDTKFLHITLHFCIGKFRHLFCLSYHRFSHHQRTQIRIREIAVIRRFLFTSHGLSDTLFHIIKACLLSHFLLIDPILIRFSLSLHFIGYGCGYKLERVDVFNLHSGTKRLLPFRPYGDIHITTKRALLHVGVRDVQVTHRSMQFFQVRHGFICASHIWL